VDVMPGQGRERNTAGVFFGSEGREFPRGAADISVVIEMFPFASALSAYPSEN
jgi:hypothetical protein